MDFFVQLNQFLDTFPITLIELTHTQDHHHLTLHTNNLLAIPHNTLRKSYPVISKRFLSLCHQTTHSQDQEVLLLSRFLLIQNPDHLTALSTRRKILKQGTLNTSSLLAKELTLTKLLLSITSHAKSSALWFHRRWVLHQLFPPSYSVSTPAAVYQPLANLPVEEMNQELDFNLKACDAYPRNYYAWFHRKWALYQLLHVVSLATPNELLTKERHSLLNFITLHPRDHSAINYIQSFLKLSTSPSSSPNDQFIADCYAVLAEYPHYETAWALLKSVSLTNNYHSIALLHASSTTSKLLFSLASNPSLPFSHDYSSSTSPNTMTTTTLAQQHSLNHQRSLILCLRTLYLLGCHSVTDYFWFF
ncbi:uncharacterized protein VP01_764g6 [Puccinia sorghi]|uniref:Geranylgeranyl transferase type-2 subunit alpha n=1 Tax=Puccinia sorghi TaxID=27349 RepID=A0A0L6UDU8_9BASI|nr:uncharacterized protein VP01_764g6 [Puccinia sorghi]